MDEACFPAAARVRCCAWQASSTSHGACPRLLAALRGAPATHQFGSLTRSASVCAWRSSAVLVSATSLICASVRCLMNTGLPRHLTVMTCARDAFGSGARKVERGKPAFEASVLLHQRRASKCRDGTYLAWVHVLEVNLHSGKREHVGGGAERSHGVDDRQARRRRVHEASATLQAANTETQEPRR